MTAETVERSERSPATPAIPVSAPAMPAERLLLGLIGSGIQLSLTPRMHELEGESQGLRIHYQLIDLERARAGVSVLPELLRAARIMDFRGLNITYPCKQAAVNELDEVAPEAARIGAVNTIVFRDGRSVGHNTDVSGWARGFCRALPGADLGHVVVIGAGGAGAAVAHAVAGLGAERITLAEPDAGRAEEVLLALRQHYPKIRVAAAAPDPHLLEAATGVVQASPVGMSKLPGMPIAPDRLRPATWVSEVIYFPIETEFLRRARERGCAVMDGGEMAIGQAVDAFELFTERAADEARMRRRFLELLRTRD